MFLITDEKIWSSQATDLDEFLPDVNESNLSLLQHAGEEALILHSLSSPINDDDEKSDELPSDLIIPDSLPEVDEQTDSSDDESISAAMALPPLQSTTNQEIKFNIRYFKDTSSSDEDSISKGLTFKDYSIVDGVQRANDDNKTETISVDKADSQRSSTFSIPSMMADIMLNLTSRSKGVLDVDKNKSLPKGPDKRHVSESSDESEFEILNTDELNIN